MNYLLNLKRMMLKMKPIGNSCFYDETKKYGNCGNFNEYENVFSKKLLKEENTCGYTRKLIDVQSTRREVKNRGGK